MAYKFFLYLLLLIVVSGSGFSQNVYRGKKLLLNTGNGYIEIVPYTNSVVRVTYKIKPAGNEKSWSTVTQPQTVNAKFINNTKVIGLQTAELKILVDKSDFSVSFIDRAGNTLSKAFNYIKRDTSAAVDFQSDGGEAFYGGGSEAVNINKRGLVLQNYNQAHFDYHFGQTDMNIAIPFLVSNRKYGLYMDNAAKSTFDVCKTDPNILRYRTIAGPVRFFFVGGNSLDEVMKNYTYLTGRQPLPPRWALGYISSRYGYKSANEIESVVDKTQKAGIPIDGVVFDLFWYKADTLMGNYNWAADSFPDPHKMLTTLLNKGIKTVLISEPYITQRSANFKYAVQHHLLAPVYTDLTRPYVFNDFWASPAALVDIFKPEAQQLYWSWYKAKIKEGVSGWWFDLLEPERSTDSLRFSIGTETVLHNVFPLVWMKNAFDGYRRDFPDRRVFILPRSGYAGMQRYSTFPWSGDNDRSFDGLSAQIPIMLNMGLSGVGYMHSDAGGFTGNKVRNPELYSRWLELASFNPVMRTHGDATGYTPEPVFWDDTTRLRVTRYIKLRCQLLPYNYTMAYTNTTTGRPLMMPVNYFEADNKRLENINDEYLWGDKILVAPVIVKGQTTKKVLFPVGEWIGFNDYRSYCDSAEVAAPVDSLPLFVKAGSVIPMVKPIYNTAQYDGRSVILKYYIGQSKEKVTSEYFYDDGKDPNTLTDMRYNLIAFTSVGSGNHHQLIITPKHTFYKHVRFVLVIPGKQVEAIKLNGKAIINNKNTVDIDLNGGVYKLDVETL